MATIDELLDELIDLSKRQFILGAGIFPFRVDRQLLNQGIERTDQRISELRNEIRKRVEEKS